MSPSSHTAALRTSPGRTGEADWNCSLTRLHSEMGTSWSGVRESRRIAALQPVRNDCRECLAARGPAATRRKFRRYSGVERPESLQQGMNGGGRSAPQTILCFSLFQLILRPLPAGDFRLSPSFSRELRPRRCPPPRSRTGNLWCPNREYVGRYQGSVSAHLRSRSSFRISSSSSFVRPKRSFKASAQKYTGAPNAPTTNTNNASSIVRRFPQSPVGPEDKVTALDQGSRLVIVRSHRWPRPRRVGAPEAPAGAWLRSRGSDGIE